MPADWPDDVPAKTSHVAGAAFAAALAVREKCLSAPTRVANTRKDLL